MARRVEVWKVSPGDEAALLRPLRWREARHVVVDADLFGWARPRDIVAVFIAMRASSRHTFEVATSYYSERMRDLLQSSSFWRNVNLDGEACDHLPNVWLGVRIENQATANERVPVLLDTPAAVRFIACELTGPVDLARAGDGAVPLWCMGHGRPATDCPNDLHLRRDFGIGWVTVSGQMGTGAAPLHPDWVRKVRDQCVAAAVPFRFTGRGEWTWDDGDAFRWPPRPFTDRTGVLHPSCGLAMTRTNPFDPCKVGHPGWTTRVTRVGRRLSGRDLDGRVWDEYPDVAGES